LSNSPELLKPNEGATDNGLQIAISNLQTDETFTALGVEYVEFLKEENENWKRLLAKKDSLIPSDLYTQIERLKERNRQLRLKMGEERRSSIQEISELEHRIENMMRRNQEKQARLDELEIQIDAERGNREEIEAKLSELKQNSAYAATLSEKLAPDAATILSQLRAKRKKSPVSLADIKAILEIIEES
jgi:undecaprenyl pyrophosphate synthase